MKRVGVLNVCASQRVVRLILGVAVALAFPLSLYSQGSDARQLGERIYAQAADSVFLLEMHDSADQQVGSGSGFLVSEDEILTNAHVVDAGAVKVRLGTFKVNCVLERVDRLNDLALCRIPARSAAPVLKLAPAEMNPGATVFALGNPRGFEKTITEGLFTGYREIDGRKVAQVSAALSPGSSGGPIVNSLGELVGVAVAILTNGQNLNFAVPSSAVRAFLKNETAAGAVSFVDMAKRLRAEQDAEIYSSAGGSPWQRLARQFRQVMLEGIANTTDLRTLSMAYDLTDILDLDVRIASARKLVQVATPPRKEWLISLATAIWFDTEGPSAQLEEAEQAVTRAISLGRPEKSDLILLGNIQEQAHKYPAAYSTFVKASAVSGAPGDQNTAIFSLFWITHELGQNVEAENWFKKLNRDEVEVDQWDAYARFLDGLGRDSEAGDAYAEASFKSPDVVSYVCEAGSSYYYGARYDEALLTARRCIELATTRKDQEARVGRAHQILASILIDRGVPQEAASHAKEAIAVTPNDAWSYHVLAQALNEQRRFTEALTAAKTAIRLSDGRFFAMHFELGASYFALQRWPEAVQAYEQAAALDPKSAAAAYNAAGALYNEQYFDRALTWYREVLKRDPNYSSKEEVLRRIERLLRR